uniref:hypothetical protein n=1 Tax=Ohtaekwangia koreensis TaxID=688867 RepID=UPI00117D730C|nr:hypothetical protein [Ohtaekwangia koreensis]
MEERFIGTARCFLMAMTWRKAFFFFAAIGFREQRYILNLAHTYMETDYKAGGRNQHKDG